MNRIPMYNDRYFFVFIAIVLCSCSRTDPEEVSASTHSIDLRGKKIVLLDSYHPEYNKSIFIRRELKAFADEEGIELDIIYLDAKHIKEDSLLRQKALEAKQLIDSKQPDLLVAADDPSNEYVVAQYYRNTDVPIISVGVNWDIEQYGFPFKNMVVQIEVEFVEDLIAELQKYAHGRRIGLLTGNTLTDRKVCRYYENNMNIDFTRKVFVNTFDEWKSSYIALQNEVDILLVRNNAGIRDWNNDEANTDVMKYTSIPTGTILQPMAPFVLIDYSKVNVEFGEYAVQAARAILSGTAPSDIPVSTNKKLQIYLNMRLAKKLHIVFPMELIEQATFVEEHRAHDASID